MTLEEARHLLSVVDGKYKERDYAILTLLLNCGMRLSELVSIDYNDIKSNDTLVITGKGNKERTVYLNDACKSAVSAYMRAAARRCKGQSFISKQPQPADQPQDGTTHGVRLFGQGRAGRSRPVRA